MRPIFLLLILSLLLVPSAMAAVPPTFTYQAVVTDAAGNPISDGTHSFRFRLYPQGNAVWHVWEETLNLTTVGGLLNATLGETVPFGGAFPAGAATFDSQYWLGVAIDGTEVIRLPLHSAPYALVAGAVDDSSITTPMIADGAVVRSINGLQDDLVLQGTNGVGVSNVGNTITITGGGGGGGADADWSVDGNDMYALPSGNVGIGTTSPTRQLTVVGSGPSGTVIEIRDQSSEQSWSEARLDMFAFDGIGGRLTMVSTTSGSRSLNLLANSPQTRITIDSQDKLGLYYDTFVELGPSSSDIKATLDDQGLFTLYNPSDVGTVEIIPNQSGGGLIGLENASGTRTVQLFGANSYGSEFEMRNVDGTRVFQVVAGASSGNRDALMTMSDAAGAQTVSIRSNSDTGANAGGGVFALRTENSVTTFKLEAQEDAATGQGSAMKFYNDSGVQTVEIDADYGNTNEGRVITDVLEITGGSDLSENFDVSSEGSELKPGTVVCIDPRNPGRLVVSRRSCDRTVAGVVSGAGGVRPGMLMGQHGSEANGKHPVALSGRVYVWCDASTGSIEPGDMLTTASTPGHAQRVDDFQKAQGAILGKAMSGLTDGRGLVLVLVTLQ